MKGKDPIDHELKDHLDKKISEITVEIVSLQGKLRKLKDARKSLYGNDDLSQKKINVEGKPNKFSKGNAIKDLIHYLQNSKEPRTRAHLCSALDMPKPTVAAVILNNPDVFKEELIKGNVGRNVSLRKES